MVTPPIIHMGKCLRNTHEGPRASAYTLSIRPRPPHRDPIQSSSIPRAPHGISMAVVECLRITRHANMARLIRAGGEE